MRPQLNVNVVLSSPMFQTAFTVVRRVSMVDDHGRTTVTETTFQATGSVQPLGINTQERPKEYAAGRKSIVVYTAFRLAAQSDGVIPDLVLWRGDNYLVQSIEDYSEIGPGFVQAHCTSQDPQDEKPQA